MLPDAVSQYLQAHRGEHVSRLKEFIRFPSVANSRPEDCLRCARWLVGQLEALGLEARVVEGPGRPNVIATCHVDDAAPTVLVYGHYDVQPPEPLEQWTSDPFEPVEREGYLYGRGASDDKGQLAAHLAAIEAWQRAGGGLPVNLKLLAEGEEEIGSPTMEQFLSAHGDELKAEAAVVSDGEFHAEGVPAITYALRGLAYVEVVFRGPSADIHSGVHGGAVTNPINALCRLVAALHDEAGRVTLEGFYDDVRAVAPEELAEWDRLGEDASAYARSLGVAELGGGERDYPPLVRRWARPTLDCNGIVGGWTGAGSKTIIPARAEAKISMRLVPDQDPKKVAAAFERFVAAHTPPGIVAETRRNAEARPVLLRRDLAEMGAARAALAEVFGAEPVFVRHGASVPVTEQIQRLLGLDAVLMGFGLPGDNIHSPNERFAVEQFFGAARACAALYGNLRERLTGPAGRG